jgi:YggT family protein
VAGWRVLLFMLQVLQILILVRVVLSWVAPHSRNPFVEFVRQVTDPILRPIQSILPSTGPFDFSALVALLIIWFLQNLIAGAMY